MTKRRPGNPKWGRVTLWSTQPIDWAPSEWELFLRREGIAESDVMGILDRKRGRPEMTVISQWVHANCHNRYVPSQVMAE